MRGGEWGSCDSATVLYVTTACLTSYRICRNFRQEKIFTNLAICSYWRNFYCVNFLSCVNDYVEDVATFTALVKIYSTEYFCNTKVGGLDENFVVYGILYL